MGKIDLAFIGATSIGWLADANELLQFISLSIAIIIGINRVLNMRWRK